MTAPTDTTDTRVVSDRVPLPDIRLAPAIAGLRARFFRDDADYEPMAELICCGDDRRRRALPADRRPTSGSTWRRTRAATDSKTSCSSRSTAGSSPARRSSGWSATTSRCTRSRARSTPTIGAAGSGDGCSTGASNARRRARRARIRTSPVKLTACVEDAALGQRALLDQAGFVPVRHFFLMRRDARRRDPGRAAARGSRDPAGRRCAPSRDHRSRERGVPRPLGPSRDDREHDHQDVRSTRARHRPVGRRLGRRRDRGRRPELDLARGERATRRAARLARAHQRPPASGAGAAWRVPSRRRRSCCCARPA